MRHRSVCVLLLAGGVCCGWASGQTIAQWTFNSAPPDADPFSGTTAPATGSGVMSPVGGPASGIAPGSPDDPAEAGGDNSAFYTTSYHITNFGSGTRGVGFAAGTGGQSSIAVSYSQRTSSAASAWWRLEYTLDGATFETTSLPAVAPGGPGEYRFPAAKSDDWQSFTWDLSSIPGASNNANFGFRIVAIFAPGTNTYVRTDSGNAAGYNPQGTMRLDLVTITGGAAPLSMCCHGSACQAGVTEAECTGPNRAYIPGSQCNTAGDFRNPCCKANFNKAAGITVQDLFDYLGAWFAREVSADANGITPGGGSGNVSVQDLFDFLGAWFEKGCT